MRPIWPIYVPLPTLAHRRLNELADAEHRRPQDQAALMLEQAIASLPPSTPDPQLSALVAP
jgi:hypothetical protein